MKNSIKTADLVNLATRINQKLGTRPIPRNIDGSWAVGHHQLINPDLWVITSPNGDLTRLLSGRTKGDLHAKMTYFLEGICAAETFAKWSNAQ
jgi:hypothetical protein